MLGWLIVKYISTGSVYVRVHMCVFFQVFMSASSR